jgi:hypothetical protein
MIRVAFVIGDTLLLLCNAGEADEDFTLSAFVDDPVWECLLETR